MSSIKKNWPQLLFIPLLFCLGFMTYKRCQAFKDRETLWLDTLEKNPTCFLALNNYGAILYERGQIDEAFVHFKASIKSNPNYGEGYNNVAWVLATHPDPNQRNPELAIKYAKKACDLAGPRYSYYRIGALDTLAAAYEANNEPNEAAKIRVLISTKKGDVK